MGANANESKSDSPKATTQYCDDRLAATKQGPTTPQTVAESNDPLPTRAARVALANQLRRHTPDARAAQANAAATDTRGAQADAAAADGKTRQSTTPQRA